MAAKGGSRSSPVLVVFLILFILATIILGVTTYLGFDGQAQYQQAAQKATDEKKNWEKDDRWHKFTALRFKAYEGEPLTKQELEDIGALSQDFAGGTGRLLSESRDPSAKDNAKVVADLDKEYGWDEAQKKAAKTFKDKIAELTKERDTLTKNFNATKADLDKAKADAASAQKELADARTLYDTRLKEAKDKFNADLAAQINTIATLQKSLDEQGEQIRKMTDTTATLKAENDKKVAALEKDRKRMELNLHKLAAKADQVNLIDFDKPKGHIVAITGNGSMPLIDLGSADNVKPQLTFSVYGAGTGGRPVTFDVLNAEGKQILGPDGKPEQEGKALVEVVRVLDPHLSQVRVTHLRDEAADPIVKGDLLYNPAWSSDQHTHVAIAGVVDLSGDGHNDMDEFLRNLTRQGVIVDAYLDLKSLTVKGPGITRQTDYLILGAEPDFPGAGAAAAKDDPRAKRRSDALEAMEKMKGKAAEEGVTLISLKKFMAVTGYHVPRGAATGARDATGFK